MADTGLESDTQMATGDTSLPGTDSTLSRCATLRETISTQQLVVDVQQPSEFRQAGLGQDYVGDGIRDLILIDRNVNWPREHRSVSLAGFLATASITPLASFDASIVITPRSYSFGFVGGDLDLDLSGDGIAEAFFVKNTCEPCETGDWTLFAITGTHRGHIESTELAELAEWSWSTVGAEFSLTESGDLLGAGAQSFVRSPNGARLAGIPRSPLTVEIHAMDTTPGHHDLGPAQVTIHEADPKNQLGREVRVRDLNADGIDDLVLTDPWHDQHGAVYVFYGPLSGHMTPDQADATYRGDGFFAKWGFFGGSLDVDDADGDGELDLLVGAPGFSTNGGNSGAAFLFLGPLVGEHTHHDADLWIEGDHAVATVGYDVLFYGDVDGDGGSDFAVTAPSWEPDPELEVSCDSADTGWRYTCRPWLDGRGAVSFWVGERRGRVPITEATYFLVDEYEPGDVGDLYGWEIHAPGDVDGDGLPDVLLPDNNDVYKRLMVFSPCAAQYMP